MKFIAEITSDLIGKLINLIQICGNEIIIYMNPEQISLTITSDPNQIRLWISASVVKLFNKYQVVSKQQNSIALKVDGQQLNQGFSLEAFSLIQVILSKTENMPILQFNHKSYEPQKLLQHKVPIIFLSPEQVIQYKEPEWKSPSVVLHLPPLRDIISWCINVKNVNQTITIFGKQNGELTLKAENESVSIITFFESPELTDAGNTSEEAEVTVDMKKFMKILKVFIINPNSSVIFLHDKSFIRMEFQLNDDEFTSSTQVGYYLPATNYV